MRIEEAFTNLRDMGYTGTLEDMLYAYLTGGGSLPDKMFADDSTCGGNIQCFLHKKSSFGTPNTWDDTAIWNDTDTWDDYQ